MTRPLAAAVWLLLLLPLPGLTYELGLDTAYPVRDEPVRVTLTHEGKPVAGVVIDVHYRPNSETTSTERLSPTGADGSTEWLPADAGIVTLEARLPAGEDAAAAINVAVRFGIFPARGILIFVVAGFLLFGGAGVGLIRLLREPLHVPAEEPPST